MPLQDRKNHWENIYQTKSLEEVSWYQPTPETSLALIKEFDLPKSAKIIDIGAGDSFLVDHLLDLGFVNITILDISASAIERAKQRLGNKSANIKWIVADASDFQPKEQYDFWHDRAAFHFLTADKEIDNYIQTAANAVSKNGIMVIGTFSEQGPKKCSGIEIQQYSESTLVSRFLKHFEKIECFTIDHKTPFDTVQNFVFCSFKRKND
ncbi:class I SAM-dependent methyltransferase [Flavobacterium petrolei]|uniref:Class I SAM-dependent methyltransferase n=1 Tax=Flavobacterium petrolei TaxID=2259594 RepID=A0A482TGI9_9FLAO|nr:class I SAM-dependent methyltransferase [Flavobacterium petrolei]RYJ50578.1 class I SAM-dependent methyltransferase [Flavobacterium petrolei]